MLLWDCVIGLRKVVQVPSHCHEVGKDENLNSIPDGWISNAGVYYYGARPGSFLTSFTASWTVPAKPLHPKSPNETVYYFIGLEDRTQGKLTTILQPVTLKVKM